MANAFAVAAGRAAVLALIPAVVITWRKVSFAYAQGLHRRVYGRSPENPTDIRPLPYLIGKRLRALTLAAKRKFLKH